MRYYPHKLLYFNNETFKAENLLKEVSHWALRVSGLRKYITGGGFSESIA